MSRLPLAIGSIFIVLLAIAANATDVHACSCAEVSPAESVNDADRIFFARIGKSVQTHRGYETRLTIFETLKGEPSVSYTWVREDRNPLCGPSYEVGELALVFVTNDDLHLCAGNMGLAAQLESMPAYLKATGHKSRDVELGYMRSALSAGLDGYTHDRKRVLVQHAPLRGKRLNVGKTSLLFRKALSKRRATKGAVMIDHAVQYESSSRAIVIISGRYPTEGIRFQLLLREGAKQPEILFKSVVEN